MRLLLHSDTDLELVETGEDHLHVEGEGSFGALQMFVSGLALCTASVLQGYAEQVLKVPTERMSIRVRWSYENDPNRIGEIQMQITWPELPESRVDAVRRAAETCTVHRTLERPPVVTTTVSR